MSERGTTLSRFTPSLMSRELLERLFVARDRILDAIVARVEAAATSGERNHTLLVGPRGSGKTHLVSLVYHRTADLRSGGARLQVAWLPEDPWTIVSYRHLLTAIVERLEPAHEGDMPRSPEQLESLLAERAAEHGPVVVLVENLDQILSALGDEGQQRLRHLLQVDRSLLLVATSTRLDRALSDQASPFYGFFTTTRLDPFDVDEAASMLTAIARERDDEDLVAYLASDEGRARLRTITHLAGGQPRMWAALASALTVGGLDELIDLLLTRFDDLTPYYQEQLGRLSGQQRLVVAELAEVDRPINVGELAERLEIEPRSLAKTMTELVDRGWATPTSSPVVGGLDRRRTYYELAEPLARLSFQIKESRGEPLRLIVEFLKHWFDPPDLGSREIHGRAAEYVLLAAQGQERDPVVAVTRSLWRLPDTRAPAVALLAEIDDALSALAGEEPEPFLRLPMPVRAALEERLRFDLPSAVRRTVHDAAQREFDFIRHPAMEEWIARAGGLVAASHGEDKTSAQLLLADWLGRAWRFDEAREVVAAAAAESDVDATLLLRTQANLATAYRESGRAHDAIELGERVVAEHEQRFGPDDRATLIARAELALSYREAGRTKDAIELQQAVLADVERSTGVDDRDVLVCRSNLALSYQDDGRIDDAIRLQEAVLAERERGLEPLHPDTVLARENLACSYLYDGRAEDAVALQEAVLAERQRLLGDEHPSTLTACANLGAVYADVGRISDAIDLDERVVQNRERFLGHRHPRTLVARSNLAYAYAHADRVQEAVALYEGVLGDTREVLGPDHPHAVLAAASLAGSYVQANRTADAIDVLKRALRDISRSHGHEHPVRDLIEDELREIESAAEHPDGPPAASPRSGLRD